MSRVFALPDLGEGLTEAEIVEWLVDEGAEVAIDQPVVVVETAKATLDVPCPYAGRLERRHGRVGESVAVGSPLVTVAAAGESTDSGQTIREQERTDGLTEQDARVGPLAGQGQYREEERAGATVPADDEGSGAVLIGYGTSGSGGVSTTARAARRAQLRGGVSRPGDSATPDRPSPAAQPAEAERAVRVISPIVRRLAADHGVDLAALSVQHGGAVLRRADVEAAVGSAGLDTARAGALARSTDGDTRAGALARSTDGDTRAGALARSTDRDAERIPLTGVRRAIAEKLSTSRREIPDATTWVDVDASALLEAKDALRRAYPDAGIGILPLLARICLASLRRFPELNSSIDTEAQEIVRHARVNLGFAAQSPRGLVVPVVHEADQLSTRELASALRDLTERARAGSLTPAELTGGTFTLNNYGVFGVDGSTPIINHPEAAMIGVGRIIERPWVVDHQLAVRHVTQVGLTFDHRVCDGGSAGGFLRAVGDGIEAPIALLADL